MAFGDILKGIEGAIGGIGAAVGGSAYVPGLPAPYPYDPGYPGTTAQGGGGFVLTAGSGGLAGSGSISTGELLLFGALALLLVFLFMAKRRRG